MKDKKIIKDSAAPKFISAAFSDPKKILSGKVTGQHRKFESGATGYYLNGKLFNEKTGLAYNINCTVILEGSKPKDKKKKK